MSFICRSRSIPHTFAPCSVPQEGTLPFGLWWSSFSGQPWQEIKGSESGVIFTPLCRPITGWLHPSHEGLSFCTYSPLHTALLILGDTVKLFCPIPSGAELPNDPSVTSQGMWLSFCFPYTPGPPLSWVPLLNSPQITQFGCHLFPGVTLTSTCS